MFNFLKKSLTYSCEFVAFNIRQITVWLIRAFLTYLTVASASSTLCPACSLSKVPPRTTLSTTVSSLVPANSSFSSVGGGASSESPKERTEAASPRGMASSKKKHK